METSIGRSAGERRDGGDVTTSGGGILRMAPLVLAAGGLLAAMTYAAGWMYLQSYYQEIGLSGSQISLSPPDYMMASFLFVEMAIAAATGALILLFVYRPFEWGVRSSPFGAWPKFIMGVHLMIGLAGAGAAAVLYVLGNPHWSLALLPAWVFAGMLVAGMLWPVGVPTTRSPLLRCLGSLAVATLVVCLVVIVPSYQGRLSAQRVLDDPGSLPSVTIHLQRVVGMQPEPGAPSAVDIGPIRLLLVNGGFYYFLRRDSTGSTVVESVREDLIDAVEYHRD